MDLQFRLEMAELVVKQVAQCPHCPSCKQVAQQYVECHMKDDKGENKKNEDNIKKLEIAVKAS